MLVEDPGYSQEYLDRKDYGEKILEQDSLVRKEFIKLNESLKAYRALIIDAYGEKFAGQKAEEIGRIDMISEILIDLLNKLRNLSPELYPEE